MVAEHEGNPEEEGEVAGQGTIDYGDHKSETGLDKDVGRPQYVKIEPDEEAMLNSDSDRAYEYSVNVLLNVFLDYLSFVLVDLDYLQQLSQKRCLGATQIVERLNKNQKL